MNTSHILLGLVLALAIVGCTEQPVDGSGAAIAKPIEHAIKAPPQTGTTTKGAEVANPDILRQRKKVPGAEKLPDIIVAPDMIVSPDMIQGPAPMPSPDIVMPNMVAGAN